MEYENLSREDLLDQIKMLENRIELLQEEKDSKELLEFPWIGNLGQWHWIVEGNRVLYNEKKVTTLGYSIDEINDDIGYEFFTEKLHPEDYNYVMKNMMDHLAGVTDSYEVEYRIQRKDGSYIWYYDRGKVVKRNEEGEPLVVSGIVFDISKNKEMEMKLAELAMKDDLTGLYNRRYFLKVLNDEINRYNRNELSFSIVISDIDDFKRVNDVYGHSVGDRILIEFVDIINQNVRKSDVFARWGGEEFIFLLTNTSSEQAYHFIEKIRSIVEYHQFTNDIRLTSSFGLMEYHRGMEIDELIQAVDMAMYYAKENGKNQLIKGNIRKCT
jgi:diguanylate cyclase (GGDEF)-like protein/PAS domain S-box-containing protein